MKSPLCIVPSMSILATSSVYGRIRAAPNGFWPDGGVVRVSSPSEVPFQPVRMGLWRDAGQLIMWYGMYCFVGLAMKKLTR